MLLLCLKLYHFEITPQFLLSTEYDIPLKILCSSAFLSLIIIGFYINDNSLSGYFSLIKDNGYKSDFSTKIWIWIDIYKYGSNGICKYRFCYNNRSSF
ncbi:hypothetical protein [Fusobacterium vincentii ATCC 49256]|uniref:Uncharacterized protein n=1 Tax=Fusobacterium vincentii ATCC 49256 TaxID=209882 RepID=Q7P4K7_FUSVC|nr:hypothetical protein [Fusobacterium vincentii ATCC 49256]